MLKFSNLTSFIMKKELRSDVTACESIVKSLENKLIDRKSRKIEFLKEKSNS